jgi:hypothetical protein
MMRFRWMTVALAALALIVAASPARALLLPVTGGPGLDQGQVCPTGSLCPGTPTYTLGGPASVAGSFTYNVGPSTVDFVLTLTGPAVFGPVTVLAGTTVSAIGVPVISAPLGGGVVAIAQSGFATGLVSPVLSAPPLTMVVNTPAVSALNCLIGTGADQCGVSLGAGGLTVNSGGPNYDVFMTFNVNVPEPGTMLLLAAGLAGIAFAGRKRA